MELSESRDLRPVVLYLTSLVRSIRSQPATLNDPELLIPNGVLTLDPRWSSMRIQGR
jgi:hypothetical protein